MSFLVAVLTAWLGPVHAAPMIKIDGSSTVYPITEAMAEEFQRAQKGKVRVTVGISGTGGGFKKFCRGEVDIQNASRPIQSGDGKKPGEMENCRQAGVKYFEIPVAFDAAAIVVNKENNFLNEITIAELKKIWEPEAQGKILKWNQVNKNWPDLPLKLYGAGADSGTFDYFTEAVVGKARASRGDYTPSEDDNVLVKGISSDKNALGYLPLAYYEENKNDLKLVGVVSPKTKKIVFPSRQTVESGTYTPLSRPLFIYVSEKAYQRPEIKKFVEFYLASASEIVPQVKYVPLPEDIYKISLKHLKEGKVGTVYGGHSFVGLKVQELVKQERRL